MECEDAGSGTTMCRANCRRSQSKLSWQAILRQVRKIWIMRHGEVEVMAKSDKDHYPNARRAQAGAQGIWLKKTALGTLIKYW